MTSDTTLKRVARRVLGSYGIDESHLVHALLRGDDSCVMLDVGAAFGVSLAPFADDGWTVHAFEPDPDNFSILQDFCGARSNVRLVPKAVSDNAGSLTLYTSGESAGVSSLAPFTDKHKPSVSIDVITLSDYIHEQTITHVDFLKVDVEGFEQSVLRGYDWSIRPRMIVLEFDDAKTVPLGYSWHDLAKDLLARGYGVLVSEWYPVVRYGGSHSWRGFKAYPCQLADPRSWGNLIATDRNFDDLLKLARITAMRHRARAAIESIRRR
jgi:FkbM family methyltransferase